MRRLAALAVSVTLAACASAPAPVRPSPPTLLRVPVPTYVPIPPAMTARCTWKADAPPSEVFLVSAGRKACLQRYELQLQAIERVQGQPAP